MLRSLPKEYEDLKRATRDGASEEVLRGLVGGALGLKEVEEGEEGGFAKLCRWQFEHHQGHARSFASTLLHGPVQGQDEVWRAACGVLKGKRRAAEEGGVSGVGVAERLVVICAADDTVVRAEIVREDLKGFMGDGEEDIVFETLPGGHGFLADKGVCTSVVEVLGREWGI